MFQGIFVDCFAGGGGASTGIAAAIGRDPDLALNHDPEAIAMHKLNHPGSEHLCQDVWQAIPIEVTKGRHVAGMWASPDCKEHSKAKGGPVKDRNIRELPWTIPYWMEAVRPDVVYLENVEEMQQWGPLERGEDGQYRVNPEHKGREWKRWIRKMRSLGYRVQWKELRACWFGAPTLRKRLYLVARCDGLPIKWPKPTHGEPGSKAVLSGKLLPFRTAADCIDWSIRCPSIFLSPDEAKEQGVRRPLKDNTLRRIAHGVMRYVVNAAQPFIVPITHTQGSPRVNSVAEPLRTITTANGGEFMVGDVTLAPHITKFHSGSVGAPMTGPMPTVSANGSSARGGNAIPLGIAAASLAQLQNGERRPGEKPREQDLAKPTSTVATGGKFAVVETELAQVSAFLSRFHTSNTNGGQGDPDSPLGAITAGGLHHAVVAAHLEQANGGPRNVTAPGLDARKPVSTVTTTGAQQRVVETTLLPEDALPPEMMRKAEICAAFLVKYYGTAIGQDASAPFDTVTTVDRFAVVTVTIDAITYVIVDIGMRMLTPRELARAQGFPDDYVLDPECWHTIRGKRVWKRLSKRSQIRMIGNSVCPDVARALVGANQPGALNDNWRETVAEMRMAA